MAEVLCVTEAELDPEFIDAIEEKLAELEDDYEDEDYEEDDD